MARRSRRYNGILERSEGIGVSTAAFTFLACCGGPRKLPLVERSIARRRPHRYRAHAIGGLPNSRAAGIELDGISLLPVLRQEQETLAERLLFFQWHRGDVPEMGRACAVRGPRFKLVQAAGRGDAQKFQPEWALYDMKADPGEQHNVIEQHAEPAKQMKQAYEAWFANVGATRGFPAPRILVGTKFENPVTLTRQDWRGPQAGWRSDGQGHWDIEVADAGSYEVTVRTPQSRLPARCD